MPHPALKPSGARLVLLSGVLAVAGALCLPLPAYAAQPFVGEVVCGGWNFCPSGWAECGGQLLSISENETLFQLIGTTYGGDGQSTFAVPDLRSRTMVGTGQGQGPGLSNYALGQMAGVESVTLTSAQLPSHTHTLAAATTATQASASPTGKVLGVASAAAPVFANTAPTTTLAADALSSAGAGQPHTNLQPYLSMKCCISLFGVFPSQN